MTGTYIRFYVQEKRRHNGILLYEWLLEAAKGMGIQGGAAFRAIAGFGRHGVMREEHFFELAGDLTVEVAFAVTEREADALLDMARKENLDIFYVKSPAEFGVTGQRG